MDLPLRHTGKTELKDESLPHRLLVLRALRALKRGNHFIVIDESSWGTILEGIPFAAALFQYFKRHEWLHPLDVVGLPGVSYFCLSERGRNFLEKGESWWASLGPLEKLRVNLLG